MKTKREPRLEIRYKGRIARRSVWRESKRWYALTESATGCQMDERSSPQFATLAEFREWARMSKRFVAMRKDERGAWYAVSAHATQEAAQGATGNGGMVDTEAPWYRAWRPVGTKQWSYVPDDVRKAFEAREF